jgi:hypothetical protein
MQEHFLAAMDDGYAENAGAILGRCLDGRHAEKRRSFSCRDELAAAAAGFYSISEA